jgi:hypothetical protein
VEGHRRVWEGIGECGRTQEIVGGHRRVWEGIGGCGRTQESVGGHRRVWEGIEKSCTNLIDNSEGKTSNGRPGIG